MDTNNEAVGAFEAASLLGCHFTRPGKLADSGELTRKIISAAGGREYAIYSRRECEDNWREYEELVRAGDFDGRPRAREDLRMSVLRELSKKDRPKILFSDAIGVDEAASMLRVYHTRVPRMIAEGRLVARVPWSLRTDGMKGRWIISKKSVVELSRELDRLEKAGKKRGRPRQPA